MTDAPKDDEGYRLSITKHRKGVKVSHPNLGWFVLDRENAKRMGLLMDQKTAPGITAPKEWK